MLLYLNIPSDSAVALRLSSRPQLKTQHSIPRLYILLSIKSRLLTQLFIKPLHTPYISLLKRWNLVEHLNADLWTQWRQCYLQYLLSRTKWRHPQRNFSVGDIVLVQDETRVQRTWPLGRIIAVYPGDDDLIRVVKILRNGKTYTRAINRLVLLVDHDDQSPPRPPVCSGSSRVRTSAAGSPSPLPL